MNYDEKNLESASEMTADSLEGLSDRELLRRAINEGLARRFQKLIDMEDKVIEEEGITFNVKPLEYYLNLYRNSIG